MVVAFDGALALSPEIPLKFPDHLRAAGKDEQIGRAVSAPQITFDLRDAGKYVLVDARIDEDPPLVKELGNAFGGGERALPRRTVDESVKSPPRILAPADPFADAVNCLRVKIHVLARAVMLRHDVNVPVEVGCVPMRGQRIFQSGIDGDIALPCLGDRERLTCEKSKQK